MLTTHVAQSLVENENVDKIPDNGMENTLTHTNKPTMFWFRNAIFRRFLKNPN